MTVGRLVSLDVGAHDGQTLEEVTKPHYPFDRIYAFEPMPREFGHLVDRFGDVDHVTLCPYGLAGKTGTLAVYGTNDEMEASLYAAKTDVDETVVTECEFVAAGEWFHLHVTVEDTVIVKLNCEGAEVDILDDLIDSEAIGMVDHVMIDFDIRKVEGEDRQEARVLSRLRQIGFDRYATAKQVMVGKTHQDRIANWLRGYPSRFWVAP